MRVWWRSRQLAVGSRPLRDLLCLFLILHFTSSLQSQDIVQAKKIVDTLTSKYFWGRGYTNKGMEKASEFIATEFKHYSLQPLTKNYKQTFEYSVNTFPGVMEVQVDGEQLRPGLEFIISPESHGLKLSADLLQKDSIHFINAEKNIEVQLCDKLTWSVASEIAPYVRIEILKKALAQPPHHIQINIENKFQSKYKASNVCGLVTGTDQTDSLLMITAHYDHLGGMGSQTYFPGANDNAAGVAMLLTLAKYYAEHPARYSIVFIAFGGEEAGLIGSKFFVDNPLVSLKKIKFLVNLDLVGTGDEGITVVNGSVYKNEFSLLNQLNNKKSYLSKIKTRGKAANSDHYWFTEKGVPSFFIYAMGGIQAYHDVYDKGQTLPLTEYEDLFRLLIEFNNQLMQQSRSMR